MIKKIEKEIEKEAEITTLQQLISMYEDSLNWLISPDYNADKNPDHDFREQDIEYFENELNELKRRLNKLTAEVGE